jgi:hypothetical protein
MTARSVRTTPAGDWFLPSDGGSGSLLRVADGVAAGDVRRIRDLGVAGLLPIGNVVSADGQVWLRTPQPPTPALDDLRGAPLTGPDAVAVLTVVVRTVAELHARGLVHGHLDGEAVFLDPDGAPLVVMIDAGRGDPAQDIDAIADIAAMLADVWCSGDAPTAELLRRCAAVARSAGPAAALEVLLPAPRVAGGPAMVGTPPAAGDHLSGVAVVS